MDILLGIDGVNYKTNIIKNDRPWGNGASFMLFDEDNQLQYKFDVVAHPEHDEFDKYQAMDLNEIADVIAHRIDSGQYVESIKKSKEKGISIMFLLNSNAN